MARLNAALARAVAVIGAALLYFAVWAADAWFGLFRPPVGFDLAHPQFVAGIVAILLSTVVAGRLAVRYAMGELLRFAGFSTSVLGVGAAVSAVLVGTGGAARPGELLLATFGVLVCWTLSTLWLFMLGRRVRRLRTEG